ncbi:MAG: hypothetical protein DRQ10_06550 [Candidatus Hydrothermota bacterium]|nr:MAG: hypothetical protein DRQ10_06550 [Candidatus Hydrothermae bacterium]
MSAEKLREIDEYLKNGFQTENPFVLQFVSTILKGGKPEENFKQHVFSDFLTELGYPPSAEIPADARGIIDYAYENGVGIEVKAPFDKKRVRSKIYSVRFLQQHFSQAIDYLKKSDFLDFVILTDGINWFFFSKKSIRNPKDPFFYHADFGYISENIQRFRYDRLRDTLRRLEEISFREPLEERFFRALAKWVQIIDKDINDIQKSIHFINALIFVRTLEDLGALDAAYLRTSFKHYEHFYPGEVDAVKEFVDFIYNHIYRIYDTELFRIRPDGVRFETVRSLLFGTPTDTELFFDTLYSFNFALIDFDVLGHVYERYLAELRKEKGIFYTPHWMVDLIVERALESAIKPILDSARAKLRDEDFDGAIAEIRKLFDIKILDPACGSGTFLAKSYVRLVKAIESFRDDFVDAYNRFVRKANRQNNDFLPLTELKSDYDLTKRHHLGERWRERLMFTLYGIDQDPRAVEVTKLNLWLALIRLNPLRFYFKDLGKARVQGVLPNLSMNIRVGDSLKTIELEKQEEMLDLHLLNLRKNYFANYMAQSDAIDEYFGILNEILEEHGLEKDGIYYRLYFPEVFEKGGFDAVIGNPPYIGEEDHKELFRRTKEYPLIKARKWYMGKMDYWYFFSHMALELLRKGGVHAFIVPSYWLKSFGSKNLVNDFKKRGRFLEIWEFGKFRVFYTRDEEEKLHYVGVDSLVFFFEKNDGGDDYEILYFRMPDEALELGR